MVPRATGQNNFRCQGHLVRWCNAGTSELIQGVPDAMLDNEEGIWYGDAVESGLEGLAERDLVS